MTCEQSRRSYIAAIEDVIEAARQTAADGERFLEQVKRSPQFAAAAQRRRWRETTESVSRLLEEEKRDFGAWDGAARRHDTRVS
jgi:hypothetical protein